jgi:hypothetical protein
MPFTISHAAAVLPFSRPLARWRLLSAAVIGSMAPDFGWFLPWHLARIETHSLDALATFCLPVGLATYWLFQWVVKTPILELLPAGAYVRWRASAAPADVKSLRQWLFAAVGILAGAVTHLVWDAFTHEGARGVRMIPALDDPVDIAGHRFGGPHLLQDVSSILGLAAIFAVLVYSLRPRRREPSAPSRRLGPPERYLWIAAYILVAASFSALFFGLRHRPLPHPYMTGVLPLSSAAIAILRGLAASLVTVSAALSIRLAMAPVREKSARNGP